MSTIHMSIVEQKNSSQNLKNLFSMTLEVQFIFINKFNFSFRQNFFKFGNPYRKTLALGSLDFSGFFSGTYVVCTMASPDIRGAGVSAPKDLR